MRTRVSELLGTEQPVIQGAMAHIADARLAAAVSNAGGLGIIAAGGQTPEWVARQIELVRSATSRPFGVNVMLKDEAAADVASLVADKHVPVVTTGAGSPADFIPAWKEAGVKVVPVVASSSQAKRMERLGADAVVAEGQESGGHIGELTTMALVPAVCAAVGIPVIAAGGIASGRGMAAALLLGAEGVQMGTRFLTVDECGIAEAYKEKVLSAKDSDTIVTGRGTSHPVRAIKNRLLRQARNIEEGKAERDAEFHLSGSLARAVAGDVEGGTMMAGQIMSVVTERGCAADVVAQVVDDCERMLGIGLDELLALNASRNLGEGSGEGGA